jgi:hypothetical protein
MKALIVIVNVVLALLLAAAVIPLFESDAPVQAAARDGSAARSRSKNRTRTSPKSKHKDKGKDKGKGKAAASAEKDSPAAGPALPQKRDEQKNAIIDSDIFSAERTPNAAFGRGANTRVELILVGTIEAGGYRAAVIVQRTNTRQINPFMRMMWGNGPGGPGGGRGGRRFNMGLNQNNQNRNNPTVVQQYVKLGQTMPNGYKLTALSRTRATLTRGGDKMELELQAPSRNQNAARRTAQRLNVNQQLQQAQIQTQQMMVRALMDMRNSGGGGGRGGNRGGNRGGRR